MEQHVRILLLRGLGTVAFGIRIGGHVKRVRLENLVDVSANVRRELRIHLIEYVLPVEQGPHLADGLVSHPRDHAADCVKHSIRSPTLVPPVLLGSGQLVGDGMPLAFLLIGQSSASSRLMLHVIYTGPHVDHRLEHRMPREILDPLAVDIHLARVADRVQILLAGSNHVQGSPLPDLDQPVQ